MREQTGHLDNTIQPKCRNNEEDRAKSNILFLRKKTQRKRMNGSEAER